ncbi:MAG TPA: FAD binding domain-containing protein [Terriglobia bacterium]|nr:FAD binding domain-containing protein [Terriglobia bacterium]
MERFEYASPGSRKEAVSLLAGEWGQTEVLAGGTDLVSSMKDRAVTPKRVVSLKKVSDLGGIRNSGKELRIGAMTTLRELIENQHVKRNHPALLESADYIRSEQLRNMGTIGGELLQRPRCWYFRLGYGLLAQDNGKPLVPDGDNRYHAILGNSGPAYFVSPSMMAPILIALGARVELYSAGGTREIALEKLYQTPTLANEREHTLHPNEILTEIIVPHPAKGSHSAVYEVRQKEAMDWPLSAAAVVLEMNGGSVSKAHVVLGHVAPVPWPSPEAEQALEGKAISEETADAAGKAAVSKATPLSMNGYKVQLTRVAVKRALLQAAQGGA